MLRWQTCVGTSLGLVAGFTILSVVGRSRLAQPAGPILPECDGHLRELVIHYEPSAREIVAPVYREFLSALEEDVVVQVVCSNEDNFAELISLVGPHRCQLRPLVVHHPLTTWSRDRWVALSPASSGGPTTVWSPRGEAADQVWPARAGDERIGNDLARSLPSRVQALRSHLYFDGGDFLADSDTVFLMPRVLPRNIQHTVDTRAELLQAVSAQVKRPVILLDEAPDHHAAMFMVAIGEHRMLVGDPSLARRFATDAATLFNHIPGGADFSPETQRLFDAVAGQCAAAGYRVTRIPVIPGTDGRTYLTYCNAIIDQQQNQRIVYLPYFRGVESLNQAARSVWENLGYQIRPVDCTTTYRHCGCLHCLVNVLSRS